MRKQSTSRAAGLGIAGRASLCPCSEQRRRELLQRQCAELRVLRRRQFNPPHNLGVFWRIPRSKCSGFWHVRMNGLERTLGFLCLSFRTAGSSGMLRDSLSPGPQFGSTKRPHLGQIARNFLCSQGGLQLSLRTCCALSRSALPAHGCLLGWAGRLEHPGSRGSHSSDGDFPLELLKLWTSLTCS